MDASQIGKIIELRLRVGPEKLANLNDALTINTNRKLTNKLRRLADRLAEFRFQLFDERMIAFVSRLRPFFLHFNWRLRRAGRGRFGGQ